MHLNKNILVYCWIILRQSKESSLGESMSCQVRFIVHNALHWNLPLFEGNILFLERNWDLWSIHVSCFWEFLVIGLQCSKKLILDMDSLPILLLTSHSSPSTPRKKHQLGSWAMIFLFRHLEDLSLSCSSVYTAILSYLYRCLDTLLLTPQKKILLFSFERAFPCQGKVSGRIPTLEVTSSAY